jgi:hypothetical protein
MSRQNAVLSSASDADTVIAGGMPSAITAPFDLERGYSIAVRVTRALLDI